MKQASRNYPRAAARKLLARPTLAFSLVVGFSLACSNPAGRETPGAFRPAASASRRIISVPAGGNLQAALERAAPGDTVVLQAGATYRGDFTVPVKPGDAYVTVTTSALSSLPPEGVRVKPTDAAYMPKLVPSDTNAAIVATRGAHHYRFVGIEFHPRHGTYNYGLISIGLGNETDPNQLPHDFVFDRVYVHGDATTGLKRGLALNGAAITVENSYFSDVKGLGQDTQALAGWNGPGPFHIVNNFLEAAGENILFGGATAHIPNLVPSDIEIRHNYFYKPWSWRRGDPSYAGQMWQVKNLLELKNARRVTIDGNLLENNWAQAQSGVAILFTPRIEDNPWDVVEDVTFTHNILRHSSSGFDVSGHGIYAGKHFLIQNNLLEDLSLKKYGGDGRIFQIFTGTDDVRIDHNTGFVDGKGVAALDVNPPATTIDHLVFTNNIFTYGEYGVIGGGKSPGTESISAYAPDAVFSHNVLVGEPPGSRPYPPDNFFPSSLRQVGFVSVAEMNYDLTPASRFESAATDGTSLGVDMRALKAATAGVAQGTPP